MTRSMSLLAVLAAGLVSVSGCAPLLSDQASTAGPQAGPPATAIISEPASEISPEPPAAATAVPVAGEQKTITLDDQGETIQLVVGERFLLNLGEGYTWDVGVSDETVVSRVRNITVIRGAQGVYEALQPGTATLSAVGDPACRQAKPPCGMPSTLFTVTLVVS